jgi:hypothetical protein
MAKKDFFTDPNSPQGRYLEAASGELFIKNGEAVLTDIWERYYFGDKFLDDKQGFVTAAMTTKGAAGSLIKLVGELESKEEMTEAVESVCQRYNLW